MKRCLLIAGFAFFLALLRCSAWAAQAPPPSSARITFTKDFPGSYPAYYSVSVRENGESLYRTAQDEKPVVFQLSQKSVEQIFALSGAFNQQGELAWESNRKVAQMGKKTFLFENGTERKAVSFNHTEIPDALALTALFERLSKTQQHRDRIEYLLRFDRLGMVKELLLLEVDLDQGRLFEPALLLPALEKVSSNKSLVKVAQDRAAGIIVKLQTAAE